MANGFLGSNDEWERIESPLQRLDNDLDAFADRHHLILVKKTGPRYLPRRLVGVSGGDGGESDYT